MIISTATNHSAVTPLPLNQMTCLSFTQSTENAVRELERLEGVRNRLAGLIVELQSTDHASADTWISIYTSRLQDNVLPAIAEVHEYLRAASQLVPATAGRHQ